MYGVFSRMNYIHSVVKDEKELFEAMEIWKIKRQP